MLDFKSRAMLYHNFLVDNWKFDAETIFIIYLKNIPSEVVVCSDCEERKIFFKIC